MSITVRKSLITRPMLAETVEDLTTIQFPVLASPKLDGIRCVFNGTRALTRKFKEVPNTHISAILETMADFTGCDGELITFTDGHPDDFNTIQSKVMSKDGEPDFALFLFDVVEESLDDPYWKRYNDLLETGWGSTNCLNNRRVVQVLAHTLIDSLEALLLYEDEMVQAGFEGIMIRSLEGGYKLGRSTLKQGWLLKVKRFQDDEAVVLDFEEQLTNTNAKEQNELGLSKRSLKKAGMVPAGTLGEFLVRDLKTGVEFKIGTGLGLSKELRQEIWDNRAEYIGKTVKYKHQPSGAKNEGKPRFPVWLGFRHNLDMGE